MRSTMNSDIRYQARLAQVPLWRVAQVLDIGENTMYVHLRKPLSEPERQKFLNAIRIAQQTTQSTLTATGR